VEGEGGGTAVSGRIGATMIEAAVQASGPFEFVLKWLPTLGWPIVIAVVWKMSRLVIKVENRALDAESTITKVKSLIDQTNECLAGQADIAKKIMDRVERVQAVIEGRQAVTHTPNPIVIDRRVEEAVSKGLAELSELTRHQSEIHTREFETMQQLAKDQAVLGTNQTNIMAGFQRVVEQLINIVNKG